MSYRDVRDLLAERGIHVNPATINRRVVKFSPLIAKQIRKQHFPRSMCWHLDETCIRVSGKWRYLWRAIDEHGRFVNFRLTARRNAKAAETFLTHAWRQCGLYPPATLVTDKAPTYPAIIEAIDDHPYYNKSVEHIDKKWLNNRVESNHAALKRIINPGKGFQTLRTAKTTLLGVEAFRTIKRGDLFQPGYDARAEVRLVNDMFGITI